MVQRSIRSFTFFARSNKRTRGQVKAAKSPVADHPAVESAARQLLLHGYSQQEIRPGRRRPCVRRRSFDVDPIDLRSLSAMLDLADVYSRVTVSSWGLGRCPDR